jgi:hypothetical protein
VYPHDIAKAQNHVELTRGKAFINSASEVGPLNFGYGEGGYGVGPNGGGEQILFWLIGQRHSSSRIYGQLAISTEKKWTGFTSPESTALNH